MPVMRPALTQAEYAQLLTRLQAVVQPLESCLLTLGLPGDFDLPRRFKAPLLRHDLTWFHAVAPVPPLTPRLAGIPEGLGALYVLEGATLGGQVISRHLRQTLNVTPERGGAYFSGYGQSTGRMWRDFSQTLDRMVAAEDQGRVLAGARETFRLFGDALQRGTA